MSVGSVDGDVSVTAVGRGELIGVGFKPGGFVLAGPVPDMIVKIDSLACLATSRAPSTTAGLMNVILLLVFFLAGDKKWLSGDVSDSRPQGVHQAIGLSSSDHPSIDKHSQRKEHPRPV